MLIFHLYGEPPLIHPLVTIFGMFSGLADVMNCAKISERSVKRFWLGWVPENGMFPTGK
jgi:hypothetical protein